MKIHHISDTHGLHNDILLPDNIDIIVHSGDCSNKRNPCFNEKEVIDFAKWFSSLSVKHKIFVPGNHDSSIESGLIKDSFFSNLGINILNNSGISIDGIEFWGSPYTKKFNDWSFMLEDNSLKYVWDLIPVTTNVLITHGPPEGILDRVFSDNDDIISVGSQTLYNKIKSLNLSAHLFGHIHSEEIVKNNGEVIKINNSAVITLNKTKFSNAACCAHGYKDRLISHGNIIDISTDKD